MSHFIVTFAFSIPLNPLIASEGDTKGGKGGKGGKPAKAPKAEKLKVGENTTRKSSPIDDEFLKNVIDIGPILADIHVEYELVPGYKFALDCCCWNFAAKVCEKYFSERTSMIYTQQGERSLRPVPYKDTNWVVFSIHHLIDFSVTQLSEFFRHTIVYQVFPGRNKFSENAKKDKPKSFYIEDEFLDPGSESKFAEIYPFEQNGALPNTDKPSVPDMPQKRHCDDETYATPEVVTYFEPIPDPVHHHKLWKTILRHNLPAKPIEIPPLVQPPTEKNVGKKNKTDKKPKKEAKGKIVTYELKVPAEALFGDMGTIMEDLAISDTPWLKSTVVFTHCKDLMKNIFARIQLNPLTINLEKLMWLPATILEDEGFIAVYAKYKFMEEEVVTPCYKPQKFVYFKLIKSFLCCELLTLNLISTLLTETLDVEVYGIRGTTEVKPEPALFGHVFGDDKISERQHPNKLKLLPRLNREILIGIAQFDLSSILRGHWEVSSTNGLLHPRAVLPAKSARLSKEMMNAMCINDEARAPNEESPLSNEVLLSEGTSVKILVRIGASLWKLLQDAVCQPVILNRIFMVLKDMQLAADILDNVLSYNRNVIGTYTTILPQYLKFGEKTEVPGTPRLGAVTSSLNKLPVPSEEFLGLSPVVTGFMIDSVDKVIFFLEGPANGHLMSVWERVMHLPTFCGSVSYNSNHFFTVRLYEDFLPFGGVLNVTLCDPLEVQLENGNFYVTGKMPRPCWKATKTVGLMILTRTMQRISQLRQCPKPQDLLSLDMELGVPYFVDEPINTPSDYEVDRKFDSLMSQFLEGKNFIDVSKDLKISSLT